MTKLLMRLFIKRNGDAEDPNVRRQYGFLSGIVGIIVNILLFVCKFIVGTASGAVSVVADALNNLSDAGSSVVNMVGFKIACSPPDREHPFGHGRAEYAAGLIISFFIVLIGAELAISSVERIFSASVPEFDCFTFIVLSASVLLKLWLFFFNRELSRKINSVPLKATAFDSISDVAATVFVLLGIGANIIFSFNLDAYIGLLVAGFIIFSGVKTAKESLSPLLGQMPDKNFVQDIKETVCSFDGIIGIHDLMIHNYGAGRSIISLHAEVPSSMTLTEAHSVIDKAESELKCKFNCVAVIHIDPVDVGDERAILLQNRIKMMIKAIDPALSIHDFRLKDLTVSFDIVMPYKFRLTEEQLGSSVLSGIKAIDDSMIPLINIERQFTELD